jgi:hypothetical protein
MASNLEPINVDAIIEKLLSVRNARPGTQVDLSETEIRGLCLHSREVLLAQPMLLELEAPIKICGTHERCVSLRRCAVLTTPFPQATFTANTTTCFVYSSMEASLQNRITSSLGTQSS